MMKATKFHKVILLILCLSGRAAIPVMAQPELETKPLMVVSISNVKELLSDLNFLGGLTGAKNNDWLAASGAFAIVDALDKTRPMGAIVETDGTDFTTLGFLPIENLDALLEALKPFVGEPNDNGDGIYEIHQPVTLYFKQANGWVFIAPNLEELSELPKDPVALLGQLNHDYDAALRAHVHNVPLIYRQMALGWIQFGIQEEMSQLEGLEDSQSKLRQQWMKDSLQQINVLINETDTITLGWTVAQESREVWVDMAMTAVEGTSSEERMKTIQMGTSDFAGFLLDDAVAAMHFHSDISTTDKQNVVRFLKGVKTGALEQLGHGEILSNDGVNGKASQVLGRLFDVFVTTAEAGALEGGATMVATAESLALVVGGALKDGQAFERSLKELANMAHEEDGVPEVDWNTAEVQGVHIHTLHLPMDDEQIMKLVGDRLEIAIGTGDHYGYIAIGTGSEALLKRVIEKSTADREEILPPSQLRIAVAPLIQYLKLWQDDFPALENVLQNDFEVTGRDRIVFETVPILRGVRNRLTLEEDVLRILAELGRRIGGQVPVQLGQEAGPRF